MLVVTAPDIRKLHRALSDMSQRALPHAAKNALNTTAFAARRQWAVEGKKTMHVRNQWTFGGRHHRVKKAKLKKNIRQMEAVTGNTLPYMALQERGFSRFSIGRGLQIPTTLSRIGRSRRRLVRRAFWRSRIKLSKSFNRADSAFAQKKGGKSRKARYIKASIRAAKASGSNFVFLDLGSTRGIFDVKTKTKMKLIWDMSRRHTRTPANPMLRRTLRSLKPVMPVFHRMALEEQIRFVRRKRGLRAA